MTVIIGPAQAISGELVALGTGLVVASFAALALPSPSDFRNGPTSRMVAWVTFAAYVLLTPRAVFFLPFFFLLTLLSDSPQPRILKRFSGSLYTGYLFALAAGTLLVFWRDPVAAKAGYAAVLRPVLGARWLSNGLWLVIVSWGLAIWRPGMLARLSRQADLWIQGGIRTHRLVFLLLFTVLLLEGLLIRLASGPYRFFAEYLIASSLPYLVVAAALFALSVNRKLTWLWVIVALMTSLLFRGFIAGRDRPLGQGGGLERCLDVVGDDDLLIVNQHDVGFYHYWVPLDRAGGGNILIHKGRQGLVNLLTQEELHSSHPSIWVLHPQKSENTWLEVFLQPDGQPLRQGKAPNWLVLKRFIPSKFPRPIVLLENEKFQDSCRNIAGLYGDRVWTGPDFTLDFSLESTELESLDLVLRGWRPDAAGPLEPELRILLNGRDLDIDQLEKTFIRCHIKSGILLPKGNTLRLIAPTFVPSEATPASNDNRELGLDLEEIILR